MGYRSRAGLAVVVLLGLGSVASGVRALAEQEAPSRPVSRTVYGKLEVVNVSVNGVAIVSDDGKRMAWQLDEKVIAQLKDFVPGDPVIVIYRQRGSDRAVTAIAFPGKAKAPIYVNTTGQRVELVSGPKVEGACGQPSEASIKRTTIPIGGRAETQDECWCCAPVGQVCVPANRTGLGQAFLIHCYE